MRRPVKVVLVLVLAAAAGVISSQLHSSGAGTIIVHCNSQHGIKVYEYIDYASD